MVKKALLILINFLLLTDNSSSYTKGKIAKSVTIIRAQSNNQAKNKITDLLADKANVIYRLTHDTAKNSTPRLIHPAITRENVICILGPAITIDPAALVQEIQQYGAKGIKISPTNLKISANASLTLSLHQAQENSDFTQAGTPKLFTKDLLGLDHEENSAALQEKVEKILIHHNALRRGVGRPEINVSALVSYLKEYAPKIAPYISDITVDLINLHKTEQPILIDGNKDTNLGFKFKDNLIMAVVDLSKDPLQKGACLDLFTLKQQIKVNGIAALALTNGDRLDGLETVKVCIGYEFNGKSVDALPLEPSLQNRIKPIYKEFKGWKHTKGIKIYQDLDHNYRIFIKFLEKEAELPVAIISTGPAGRDAIIRQNPFTMKLGE